VEKEKVYNRQVSAPILKRKTSRFGLGQLITGNNSSNQTAVANSQNSHSQNYSYTHPHSQTHQPSSHQNYLQVIFPQKLSTPTSPHHTIGSSSLPNQPPLSALPQNNQTNAATTPLTPTMNMSDHVVAPPPAQVFFVQQPQLPHQTFHSAGMGVSGK
jgi:hypothetical protein